MTLLISVRGDSYAALASKILHFCLTYFMHFHLSKATISYVTLRKKFDPQLIFISSNPALMLVLGRPTVVILGTECEKNGFFCAWAQGRFQGGQGTAAPSEISAPFCALPPPKNKKNKKFKIGRHLPKFSAKVIKLRIG